MDYEISYRGKKINAFLTPNNDEFLFCHDGYLNSTDFVNIDGHLTAKNDRKLIPITDLKYIFGGCYPIFNNNSVTEKIESRNTRDLEITDEKFMKGIHDLESREIEISQKSTGLFIKSMIDIMSQEISNSGDLKRNVSKMSGQWFNNFCKKS